MPRSSPCTATSEKPPKLLVRPIPRPGESYFGYLIRVVEKNGYPAPAWLGSKLKIGSLQRPDSNALLVLAESLGIECDRLDAIAPTRSSTNAPYINLENKLIHSNAVERSATRICPACLEEDEFIPGSWSIRAIAACPKHGVILLDSCDRCGARLSWNRGKLRECDCSRDLRALTARPANRKLRSLSNDLKEVFSNTAGANQPEALPSEFVTMRFHELVDDIYLLGGYLTGLGAGGCRRLANQLSSTANASLLLGVTALFEDWPNAFFMMLERMRHQAARDKARSGLEAEFQSFYLAMFSGLSCDARLSPLQNAFLHYATEFWKGGVINAKNARLGEITPEERRYLPLTEAAREVGLHPGTLRKAVTAGYLETTEVKAKSRTYQLIDRQHLADFLERRQNIVTLQRAKRLLGLSKKSLLGLVRDGMLPAPRGPALDGSTHWEFRRSDIRRLLSRFDDVPQAICEISNEISFYGAIRKATASGITATRFVRAILHGLHPIRRAPGALGFQGFYFDGDEVSEFLHNTKETAKWAVSIQKAARLLRLNEEATRHLVKFDIIKTVEVISDGRARRLVAIKEIRRFEDEYVSASELAARCKTSPRALVAEMVAAGVLPVTGPCVDGGRQYFFFRTVNVPQMP